MSTVTTQFSGVVIDQNSPLATTAAGATSVIFTLPDDYVRGSTDPITGATNQIIPDLTGFQIFALVEDVDECSITWNLVVNSQIIASGVNTGTANAGYTWFSVALNDSIPVPALWLNLPFTLNITATVDIELAFSVGPALMYRILASTADSGTDFLGNVYRSAILESTIENTNVFQSENVFSSWMSNPCPSRFGVEAFYMDIRQGDQPAVIDRLTIDPMTPGVAFHLYYSNDPMGPGVDVPSWENLLWTPVYKTFQVNRAQTFALPEPITAKFVCIEFTNLQARSYNPGNFQLPSTYNKYPQWVLNYFIGAYKALEVDRLSSQINVVYDALDLAYTYYQGDIIQEPDPPVQAQLPVSQQNPFVQSQSTNQVDPTTLQKISTNFQPFLVQPGLAGGDQSMISQYAGITAPTSYSTETISTAVGNTTYVSNLQRDALLVEKGFPTMFFYLPCRHSFRVVQAEFQTNVAYFAGIKQLVLHRDVYTGYTDQTQYNETLGDGTNISLNDWQDPGSLPQANSGACPNWLTNPSFEFPITPDVPNIGDAGWGLYQSDPHNPTPTSLATYARTTEWASGGTYSLDVRAPGTAGPTFDYVVNTNMVNLQDQQINAPYLKPLSAGTFVSLCVSSGIQELNSFGNLTDTQGNTYIQDAETGTMSVYSAVLTSPVTEDDSINQSQFTPIGINMRIVGFTFTNVEAGVVQSDSDSEQGPYSHYGVEDFISVTPGQLIIAWGTVSQGPTNIATDGSDWITPIFDYGDNLGTLTMGYQQVTETSGNYQHAVLSSGPGTTIGNIQVSYNTTGTVVGPTNNYTPPSPYPNLVIDAAGSGNDAATFAFSGSAEVGDFLSIVVCDGSGWNIANDLTDSVGNTYSLDTTAYPSGSLTVFSSTITNAISPGDTLTITFGGNWFAFHVLGTVFQNAGAIDVVGSTQGNYGPQTLAVTVTPNVGDLVIGYSCFQQPVIVGDPDPSWNAWVANYAADNQNFVEAAWQQVSSASPLTWTIYGADQEGFAAGVLLAYTTTGTVSGPPGRSPEPNQDLLVVDDFNEDAVSTSVPFINPVEAGSFLSLAYFAGQGDNGATPTSVTDTQGNTYLIDGGTTDRFNYAIWVFSSVIEHPLTPQDTFTINWSTSNDYYGYIIANIFTNVTGLDVAGTAVFNDETETGPFTLSPTVIPSVDDLVIGYSVFSNPQAVPDPDPSWNEVVTDYGDPVNRISMAWQQVDSDNEVTWNSQNNTDWGRSNNTAGVALLVAYHTSGTVSGPSLYAPITNRVGPAVRWDIAAIDPATYF